MDDQGKARGAFQLKTSHFASQKFNLDNSSNSKNIHEESTSYNGDI